MTACISIHALREEGDQRGGRKKQSMANFYPRPPRGGRPPRLPHDLLTKSFLSTPSARRATHQRTAESAKIRNFYPRPPRGGRPKLVCVLFRAVKISIHALREEGDTLSSTPDASSMIFLSTPSARRATGAPGARLCAARFLSTPSARRATVRAVLCCQRNMNFYPRPPRGGRRLNILMWAFPF